MTLVRQAGSLVVYDRAGLPVHGSTDRWSPFYFDMRDVWLEFNGRSVEQMQVFEFHTEEDWIMRENPYTGTDEQLHGRVRVRWRLPLLI